jgi:dTDP-4-amino-4,6-dideoxygalactose transaminase
MNLNPTKLKTERIFLSPPHMSGKEIEYVREAFESNYIAPVGPQLNQFEALFKELTGFEHCVAVVNGTAAIHLLLRSLGVGEGDVVLGSTLTFVGSVAAVKYQNADLVFIDSDRETWNMDPNLLEQEINSMLSKGQKPAAVIPTELYGQACDLDRIVEICSRHDIPVICDSAESLGATYNGRSVGRAARAATFSFNGNKILTTSGGGMIGSDDAELVDQCRYLATQARQPVLHYDHHEIGFNYRMSNVLAAIGIGQLEVLSERVERRREINGLYYALLEDIDEISFMPEAAYGESNKWLTVITLGKDSKVQPLDIISALDAENIESRPVWNPLHLHKAFADCRCVGGEVAKSLYESGVCLPSGSSMSDDDVHRVAGVIKSAFGK